MFTANAPRFPPPESGKHYVLANGQLILAEGPNEVGPGALKLSSTLDKDSFNVHAVASAKHRESILHEKEWTMKDSPTKKGRFAGTPSRVFDPHSFSPSSPARARQNRERQPEVAGVGEVGRQPRRRDPYPHVTSRFLDEEHKYSPCSPRRMGAFRTKAPSPSAQFRAKPAPRRPAAPPAPEPQERRQVPAPRAPAPARQQQQPQPQQNGAAASVPPRAEVTSPELASSPAEMQDAEFCVRYALKMRDLEDELMSSNLQEQEDLMSRINYYKSMINQKAGGSEIMFLSKEELQAKLKSLRK